MNLQKYLLNMPFSYFESLFTEENYYMSFYRVNNFNEIYKIYDKIPRKTTVIILHKNGSINSDAEIKLSEKEVNKIIFINLGELLTKCFFERDSETIRNLYEYKNKAIESISNKAPFALVSMSVVSNKEKTAVQFIFEAIIYATLLEYLEAR